MKSDSLGNIQWAKTYANSFDSWFNDVRKTTDDGYILTGTIQVNSMGEVDIYVLRTDSLGNIMWVKRFGQTGAQDAGSSIRQTADGNFVLTGYMSNCSNSNIWDPFIIKLDSLGNLQWSKEIGFNISLMEGRVGNCIQQTTDGGYIISASQSDIFNDYLIKLDSNANLWWCKTYSYPSFAYGFGWNGYVIQENQGYVLAGQLWDNTFGGFDLYLMKVDSLGNCLWGKTYGGTGTEYLYGFEPVDSGYALCGISSSLAPSGWSSYLMKTDLNGNQLWTKSYGGTSIWVSAFKQTPNNGYMVFGGSGDYSFGTGYNGIVIKTDSIGNSGICNGITNQFAVNNFFPTVSQDGYIAQGCGGSNIFPTIINPVIIDSILCIDSITVDPPAGIKEENNENNVYCSPNPTTGIFQITSNELRITNVEIVNLLGEQIQKLAVGSKQLANNSPITIDLSSHSNGVYFLQLTSDKGPARKKIVISK